MDSEQVRPNKRRRVGTACQSCRTAKARCELQQHENRCHRCNILEFVNVVAAQYWTDDSGSIECELPERALVSGSQNNGFEDRLHRIEEIILRLSEAVFPQAASSSAPNGESRTPTNGAGTDSLPSNNYPRPVEIIRDLQYELLDERHESSDEHSKYMDVVSTGIITPQVASSLLHTYDRL